MYCKTPVLCLSFCSRSVLCLSFSSRSVLFSVFSLLLSELSLIDECLVCTSGPLCKWPSSPGFMRPEICSENAIRNDKSEFSGTHVTFSYSYLVHVSQHLCTVDCGLAVYMRKNYENKLMGPCVSLHHALCIEYRAIIIACMLIIWLSHDQLCVSCDMFSPLTLCS